MTPGTKTPVFLETFKNTDQSGMDPLVPEELPMTGQRRTTMRNKLHIGSRPGLTAWWTALFVLPGVLAIFLAIVLGAPVSCLAQTQWNDLTEQQRQVLSPYHDQWDSLSPEQQERARKGADRWSAMTPEQRTQAASRLKQWRDLPQEQRDRIRQRFEQYRQLPAQEKERLRCMRERYRNMPREQRESLRQRWQSMTPEERATARAEYQQRRQGRNSGSGMNNGRRMNQNSQEQPDRMRQGRNRLSLPDEECPDQDSTQNGRRRGGKR